MADEDKEKAEKLAAAKKRFEQLKKEQQKKGKKAGNKKKDDKAATDESKVEDTTAEPTTTEEPGESTTAIDDETPEAPKTAGGDASTEDGERAMPASQPSASLQSKQRSESFRQGSAGILSPVATDLKNGSGPMSPGPEVQELYKKQAARIEGLERENSLFREQQEEGVARLAKAEEELQGLREGSSDMAELRSKAKDTDRISTELASVQRQLAQAQQAAKGNNRRVSGASPDVSGQLESKISTIESLELELSNLRNQSNGLRNALTERDTSARDLDEKVRAAETATESYKQELDQLKVSMAFPSDDTKAANEDPEALTKRITVLESDLRTAHTNLDAAQHRATSLEQKIEALTKLHRDATTTSTTKDKELAELRTQLKRRDRPSHVRDASEFELGEEETESGTLHARIRALEAENFDLRRGVWRDKRAELQPGIDDHNGGPSPEYEDVDLNGPYSPHLHRGSLPRQTSTFQDVLTSGISAFTGRPREPPSKIGHAASPAHGREQSLGLLSDDDGFDEDAFRQAQEEEGKRRVERVKEVKRGLEKWKGWRVELFEQRQQGVGGGRDAGPVFEV